MADSKKKSFHRARVAILASGKGSNAKALLEAEQKLNPLYYEIVLLISDVREAPVLNLGKEFNKESFFLDPGPSKTLLDEQSEQFLIESLQEHAIDFILLAGFMRILKAPLLRTFPERVINIHPSLLPDFKGLRAWEQAYHAKVKKVGCTVHLVDEGIDTGKILAQASVDLQGEETAEQIHQKIQLLEHQLYPKVINEIAAASLSSHPQSKEE